MTLGVSRPAKSLQQAPPQNHPKDYKSLAVIHNLWQKAFDKIEAAGDMQPSLVAGGIKVALLTTVFGLIAAIILQIFYNYIVSKVDGLVNEMEDASISLVDMMLKNKIAKV